ncbi:MAG: LysR family transcriptional regulator [Bacteroidales bacterium]|nr:LysR family transcriptional regulator [Bacteroidales bacterium]
MKIFVAVAECGGFTAAAHRLKMSQPAVSQSVASLEGEAGVELFLRTRSGVELTGAGQLFYGYAVRILSLYESLSSELTGAGVLPEQTRLPLGGGRSAAVSVSRGKIEIEIIGK